MGLLYLQQVRDVWAVFVFCFFCLFVFCVFFFFFCLLLFFVFFFLFFFVFVFFFFLFCFVFFHLASLSSFTNASSLGKLLDILKYQHGLGLYNPTELSFTTGGVPAKVPFSRSKSVNG